MTPRATYRLQFHAGFTFADAEAIVPYLADLGISHAYASPVTMAARGSTHGYDVIDPTTINPELGGMVGLQALVAALRAHDMGLIIDIVPNHMGVAGDENRWWMDVLEKGQASDFASVFDIDWNGPLVLPVLGSPPDRAIAAGDVRLIERDRNLCIQVHGGPCYPIRPDDPVLHQDRGVALASHDHDSLSGRTALCDLLARQHYRLVYWRCANDLLNWRRFFAINELAAVRVEDPAVFERTHRLFFDLFQQGLIDGVRVDHVDGLADPASYCRALRAGFEAVAPDRHAYIVIEKILAADEPLATDWGLEGTSGYDFMREVSGLLHAPQGDVPLRTAWANISGRSASFEKEAFEARRDLLAWQFDGQLAACVDSFLRLSETSGQQWLTRGMLRRAIERLLWVFPVYRTYGVGDFAPASDRPIRDRAAQAALALAPPGETGVMSFILDRLAGIGDMPPLLAADAVRRFQQLSAPVAAKGVEDTAFYRHAALLSFNDVGFDPGRSALSIADFHAAMTARADRHPHAMLATATHDHKRGEDARARLAVISAIAQVWDARVRHWTLLAKEADIPAVDPADLYHLFQAFVGAWDGGARLDAIHDWQDKMLREAKLRSSWEAPDTDYEERYRAVATLLLDPDGKGAAFQKDFRAFMDEIGPAAMANSLVQTFLHYTVPGVPDLYQGCELMDYSMVDPDNRRPVDYAARRAILDGMPSGTDGAAKLALISTLLQYRRISPALFSEGRYTAVTVTGHRADHVVAFTRTHRGETLFCAAAIRLSPLLFGGDAAVPDPDWWGDTCLHDAGQSLLAADLFRDAVVHIDRRPDAFH